MKKNFRICIMACICLFLAACSKKDSLIKAFSDQAASESCDFESIDNLDLLSGLSSDPEVAESFSQIITDLSTEQNTDKVVQLLNVFEKNDYQNPEVAKCVADTYWGNNEGIMRLIEDENYEPLLKLSYYGPVEGVKKVGNDQIENLTEQMTIMDKVELWKKIDDASYGIKGWKDMIPLSTQDFSEYTSEMSLTEKLDFLEELPSGIETPDIINAEDVNSYINNNGIEIQTTSGSGGYYDYPQNQRFRARNRKIMPNGDIWTDTAIRYIGDFAVIETDVEYLNSYYEIKHKNIHAMYFRGTELDIEGNIDVFKYAPPYLFSITESKTDIFEVDNTQHAYVIYSVE